MPPLAGQVTGTARFATIVIVTLSVLAPPSHVADAQFRTHYGQGLSLSSEDIDRLDEATRKVLGDKVGATESWANPITGNSGTVRFAETSVRDGMPCRTVEHVVKHKGIANPSTFVARRCQLPNGAWKLY